MFIPIPNLRRHCRAKQIANSCFQINTHKGVQTKLKPQRTPMPNLTARKYVHTYSQFKQTLHSKANCEFRLPNQYSQMNSNQAKAPKNNYAQFDCSETRSKEKKKNK